MPPPGHLRCVPPYLPEKGQEDVRRHCESGKKIYVVGNGTICGIFSSEARARKQIEGFSNGRWRSAKSWGLAIDIWGEYCDSYHEDGCPPHRDPTLANPAEGKVPAPTNREDVLAHNAGVKYRTDRFPTVGYRATPITEQQAAAIMSAGANPSPSPASGSTSARLNRTPSPSKKKIARTRSVPVAPPSPLDRMDPAEAFSRMGLGDPSPNVPPMKQWAVSGVSKFFATRIDAIDHILTLHLGYACILGSRNVRKLRAFARQVPYVPEAGDVDYDDDE
ncbi:hypothetical protein B0H13DRAFT_1919385 [Mycena leptocephala]|nr:hypothetical protein B0H13DRAFT_1919385 [Mycena leptocephala]